MRSTRSLLALGLLVGCTPASTPSTQNPEPAVADAGANDGGNAEVGDPSGASASGSPDGAAGDPGGAATSPTASEAAAGGTSEASEGATGTDAGAGASGGATDAGAGTSGDTTDAGAGTNAGAAPPTGSGDSPERTSAKATLDLPKPIHGKVDAKCGKDPGVGQKLKSFSLPSAAGDKKISNGTFRGRVLVVNFWGTWCKPCLKELPEFDHLYRRYRKHGMTLLAIATDEEPEGVNDFVNKRKLAAKMAIAGEAYANQYGSPKFPFTFIVDHRGVIRASYRGYKPECMGKLEADIREQLVKRAEARARRKAKKG